MKYRFALFILIGNHLKYVHQLLSFLLSSDWMTTTCLRFFMTVLITYIPCHCPSKPLNCPRYVNITVSKLLLEDGSPQLEILCQTIFDILFRKYHSISLTKEKKKKKKLNWWYLLLKVCSTFCLPLKL